MKGSRIRKTIGVVLALAMCFTVLAACAGDPEPPDVETPVATPTPEAPPVIHEEEPEPPPPEHIDVLREMYGLDENFRFIDQRTITVLTWDRRHEGAAYGPTDNAFTDWIKEQMLELHNVVVEFDSVFRWEEVDELTMMLAEGAAPDVCYTFNFATIDEFGRQGAVTNLQPLLDDSQDLFPHLWDLLGWNLLFWNQDSDTGHIWSIVGINTLNQRYVPFIREDWLATLNLPLPTTLEEFEAALKAFRDNAELLLGADARHIVPLHMTQDIGWVFGPLLESFIPNDISDRDFFITDVGGPRNFFRPSSKEAIRLLNYWYHEGLIDPDFALYATGDDTVENQLRAGWTGAVMHSWDQPYRGGEDGWTGRMHDLVGPEANFIAVDTFPNDAGYYRKYLGAGNDRNLFIPATSTEPIAALLYLDFLSRPEVIEHLQIGWEGINHEIIDGAAANIAADNQTRYFMQSGMNYDLTMPVNGLRLTDPDFTTASRALGYAGVAARLIEASVRVQTNDVRIVSLNLGTITAEEGMADTIRERAQAAWARAVIAPIDQFDAVYDSEMQVLLNEFAQASMDERAALWEAAYGSATMVPTG